MQIKHLKKGILISFAVSFILSSFFIIGLFSNIQISLSDNFYGGKTANDNIVVIAIDDKSLQEIGRWPWNRNEFANVIRLLKDSSVVAIDVAFFEKSENDKEIIDAVRSSGNVILPVEYTSYIEENGSIIGKDILLPINGLRENTSLGYINIISDKDGVSRAVNMDIKGEYDSFAELIYEKYTDNKFKLKSQRLLVNFVGRPGSFTTYSFTDVVNGRIDAADFRDKIILIGATSPDMHDDYFVPTSNGKAMPGVEIHANTLQTMINEDFLYLEDDLILILTIFISSIITLFLIYRFSVPISSLIIFGLIILYTFISINLFDMGIIMNLVYIPLSFISTQISLIAYFYFSEKKEKDRITSAFGKYVSPHIVKELIEHPEKLNLGGEKRTITVFFSDIRGFTNLAERFKPEELVNFLNEYLSDMTNIIIDNGGVVDKYIGDAIMAFWGAPLDEKDHAKLACETSLQMINRLELLRKKWKDEGKPEINIGCGINSGEAVIGNMGSDKRFDYTAMGDAVNLGSRLEGLTKQYGVNIIISENTKKYVNDEFLVRELDFVAVKGKKEPIKIYELICLINDATKRDIKLKDMFENGLKNYSEMRWDNAIKYFKDCLNIKEDKASKIFIERCLDYKKNPPDKNWNHVWVMKTK